LDGDRFYLNSLTLARAQTNAAGRKERREKREERERERERESERAREGGRGEEEESRAENAREMLKGNERTRQRRLSFGCKKQIGQSFSCQKVSGGGGELGKRPEEG
jgi:hypothetical protein